MIPKLIESDGILTLSFGSEAQSQTVIGQPDIIVSEYIRQLALLTDRYSPKRMLMIGLGGGSLAKHVVSKIPTCNLTVVENNQLVILQSHRFSIPPVSPRFHIICDDGAEFVSQFTNAFDMIVLDAYLAECIVPDVFLHAKFYEDCNKALTADGIFLANCLDATLITQSVLGRAIGQHIDTYPVNPGQCIISIRKDKY